MNFYLSDLHFDHTNIIRLCHRPFENIDQMNSTLIENWNKRVTNKDHVYLLGDVCMNADRFEHFMLLLNGIKHVIIGNHDPRDIRKRKIQNTFFMNNIQKVNDGEHVIVLCHYPLFEWPEYYKGAYHFYGHVHGNRSKYDKMAFEVGVDVQNFEPKTFDEIIK